ncbi:MAG: hypothetical protein NVSMB57_06990 [Actinomycetota bacterium]
MSTKDRATAFARILLVTSLAIALASCSSGTKKGQKPSSSSPTTVASSTGEATSGPVATLPGEKKGTGIKAVQMATVIAKDGSAKDPRSTFHTGSDRTIIAVISIAKLPAKTKLSYIRYLNGRFVNSKSAELKKPAKYFYFKFTALPGKSLSKGHYRLRLYVNGHATWEVSYNIV